MTTTCLLQLLRGEPEVSIGSLDPAHIDCSRLLCFLNDTLIFHSSISFFATLLQDIARCALPLSLILRCITEVNLHTTRSCKSINNDTSACSALGTCHASFRRGQSAENARSGMCSRRDMARNMA